MAAQVGAYLKFMATALAGLVAFAGHRATSIVSATASTTVLFGRAVGVAAASPDLVAQGLGTGFMGISIRQTAKQNVAVGAESGQYEVEETVGIMQLGNVWVDIGANTVIDGDPVWFNDTTGIFDSAGGVGDTQINNAKFVGASGNGIHQVLLEGITQTTAGV